MSRPLIACASLLLTALTLATPAAARPERGPVESTSALDHPEAEVLRQRVARQIVRASRQLDELARSGALAPEQLARAGGLRQRVVEQTDRILAGDRVTAEDQSALRSLKREARAFRRELRADLRTRRRERR